MDPWTPEQRNAFIREAVESKDMKGKSKHGPYYFNVYPRIDTACHDDDPKRAMVTDAFSSVIYNNPEYRPLALNFYQVLIRKMMAHPLLQYHMNSDIVVVIKGSNAHLYLVPNSEVVRPSDMDLSVCINPNLPESLFLEIKTQVEIIVKQSISQYKRTLDHMLFLHKKLDSAFMTDDVIAKFQKDYAMTLKDLQLPIKQELETEDVEQEKKKSASHEFISPFESDEFRNECSRHSFFLTNSTGHENSVVRVEVPHFERCERIPLRKTPLFCSFNETIDFIRDGIEMKGQFNLYRLRMNNLIAHFDDDGKLLREEKVACDFIDVSVPNRDDAELRLFWNRGHCVSIYEESIGFWVTVPDPDTCIAELERILTQYDSQESKKEKREKKLEELRRMKHCY